VEGVDADLGLGHGIADGLLVAARHVDRDGPDRALALAELCEERLQGLSVATRAHPDDRARAMVGNGRQVALTLAIADLIDADLDEPGEPALVEVVADDALDDPADGLPSDPEQRRDRRLGHLLGEEGDHVLEVARVADARPGEGHRFHPHAAVGADDAPQAVLDEAALATEIEVAPATGMAIVHPGEDLAAARAHRAPPAERNLDDHPLRAERDVDDPGAGQAQQAVECGGDAHAVPRRRSLTFDSQQPPRAGGCASLPLRNLREAIKRAGSRPSPGDYGRHVLAPIHGHSSRRCQPDRGQTAKAGPGITRDAICTCVGVSIREPRNHGGEVVDRIARGEQITITRAGRPVAELRSCVRVPPDRAAHHRGDAGGAFGRSPGST
jgi:hypothetical protein